jgi:diacylglycerol kinase family enzyme
MRDIRVFSALALMPLFVSVTAGAGDKSPADYPLRVFVVETHWDRRPQGTTGYSHGNVQEGNSVTRFAASASQKLSIASNSDGADIEVDGEFVGSTPSVIELSTGEHSVVIRKLGYKPWERKLRLGGGDVKLKADWEKATGGNSANL